jgi:hypothetical protein
MIRPLKMVYLVCLVYLVCFVISPEKKDAGFHVPHASCHNQGLDASTVRQDGNKKAQRGSLRLSGLRESMPRQLFFQCL